MYLEAEVTANDLTSSPEGMAETRFEQQQLRRAILQLPSDQQQVIMMRFVEGFSYAEVASLLGKSEGALRVILHRALVALRHTLEKEKG